MPSEILDTQAALEHSTGGKTIPRNPFHIALAPFDYAYLAITTLLLIPAFRLAHLPFRMNFADLAKAYWGGEFAHSAFVAIVLYVLGFPFQQTLVPMLRRFQKQKARIAIALTIAVMLSWILGIELGLMVTVEALALGELMERRKKAFEPTLIDLFWPGLYLFLGIIVKFAFNSAVAGVRWAATYDPFFKHLDWILFHVNVSSLSHWFLNHSPHWIPSLFEFAYYGLFPQMGAVLILAVVLGSQHYAVRFVRTLLIGYAIALLAFMMFPSTGPYYFCPDHVLHYPHWLATYSVQQELGAEVRMLWAHAIPPGCAHCRRLLHQFSLHAHCAGHHLHMVPSPLEMALPDCACLGCAHPLSGDHSA